MEKLLNFLQRLEETKIYYQLNKYREAVMVEISVPGEKWEVEFFEDGHLEIEKFISDGNLSGETEIEVLFRNFSD